VKARFPFLVVAALVVPLTVDAQTKASFGTTTPVTSVGAPTTNSASAPLPIGTALPGYVPLDVPGFNREASGDAQIKPLYQAWLAERDHRKRQELADQVIESIMHDYDNPPLTLADEVARDGLPVHIISPPTSVERVKLRSLFLLPNAHRDEMEEPGSPVFRRFATNRIEAWVPAEGWLFDGAGKLIEQAKVPRRDGGGREWFGAFLPNGWWITTDLWDNDRQLTCFDPQGDPRWELPGQKLALAIDAINHSGAPNPSVGWARADRTGNAWLVSVGWNGMVGYAVVTPRRGMRALPNDAKLWRQVYPRSMTVRGMYTELFIDSDDGKATLSREEAGHGVGVGWPLFTLGKQRATTFDEPDRATWRMVLHNGGDSFGFWPGSHETFIESTTDAREPDRTWFFDENGRYEGEATGDYLADAANGHDLLLLNHETEVDTVRRGTEVPAVVKARKFIWSDGTPAIPLALYDGLRLGFFLHTKKSATDLATDRTMRTAAAIELASW
jgi:hypothetical protein